MKSFSCVSAVRRPEHTEIPVCSVYLAVLLILGMFPGYAAAVCTGGGGANATALTTVDHLRSFRAGFRAPARLTLDAAGNVYVTDAVGGRVVGRRSDGKLFFELEGLGYPVSVAVDAAGTLYVGDGKAGRIDAYDAAGQFLHTLGVGAGEFELPNDIVLDPVSGDILVADAGADLVKRYSPGGNLLSSFGGTGDGDGQFNFPAALAASASEIFVIDQRNSRIQVFDLSGGFQFCIDSENQHGGFNCGGWFCGGERRFDQGIWVDASDRIYVVDAFEGAVYVMGRNGTIVSAFGGLGTGPGKFRSPTDIVIDGFGRAYVASSAGATVEMFGLDSFSDPEQFVSANLQVTPDPFDHASDDALIAHLEIPGYPLSQVDQSSVFANGVAAPLNITSGDADNDAIPDLKLVFGPGLIQSLPLNGDATITVTGTLDGLQFEQSDLIKVTSPGDVDSDGDGVVDQNDLCAGTPADAIVTPDGCSIAERCPCIDQDKPGKGKGNAHGQYMSCVAGVTNELVALGLMTGQQKGRLMKDVAKQGCRE